MLQRQYSIMKRAFNSDVNDFTSINKTTPRPKLVNKRTTRTIAVEFQILAWNKHTNVEVLNSYCDLEDKNNK
jgi:ribosomal protein L15E